MKAAAVILAGGASSRMGSPKALLPYQGTTFLARLASAFQQHCEPVILVLGYAADSLRAAAPAGIQVVVNPAPERGQLSSLQCGLAAVPAGAEAIAFCPVDYPLVQPATVARLLAAIGDCAVAIPTFDGRHGHPVLFRRELLPEFLRATTSARDVLHAHRTATTFVAVDDPGVLRDVDTPEDYRALTGGAA